MIDEVDEFDSQNVETEVWRFLTKSNSYQGYPSHISFVYPTRICTHTEGNEDDCCSHTVRYVLCLLTCVS